MTVRATTWVHIPMAAVLGLGLVSCAGPNHPDVTFIEITGTGFRPAAVTIGPGEEVRWVNRTPGRTTVSATGQDEAGISAVPTGAAPFTSDPLTEGQTFAMRLDTPGTYVFVSDEQRDWVGTVTVEESS